MTKPQAVFGNIEKLLANVVEETEPSGALSGDPKTYLGELLSQDGLDVGVWRCTPGVWEYDSYDVNEVMVMLSGRMRLTDSDGNATELTKGDVFYIPRGWAGKWETLETMEKVYVIMDQATG
ncbi:MAG TPA: cupin domain-containing protein [Anaerolineales bacterium]|nr:cupin domain-containing protein [Anaerolineales bacterium]